MKNYVILLAGGVGKRMGTDIPKQFLEVDGKPIIVYSIENFQRNPQIEKIVVVCVKDWIDKTWELIRKYSLTKVEWIIEGGNTGHDSIRNGVFFLKDKIDPDDHIIVHDAVRPVLPQKAIDEVIRVSHEITDVDREHVTLTASPQAFRFSLALKCYEMAEEENYHTSTFTSSLLIHCHERVYFAKGTSCNIKITRKEDLALFEALLKIPEEHLYN